MEHYNDNTKMEDLQMGIKEDFMVGEAVERLNLMGAHYMETSKILFERQAELKIVVNHEEKSIRRKKITDEEREMIDKIEEEYGFFVYYLIEDEGVWPDGCTFKRYTLPYVSSNEEEYEMDREDAIKRCGTCPAYIVNMEDPDCSEITEFAYQNVEGMIINAS